ncbi:PadR family transcriptional regulator [Paenibacillus doosanensis]|uniref:PadR family transcriptional regulator n=1 Tax=Paenibacillus doosanensis TaxID=1229154 RepID=UPI0021801735|nr:PadR family transcriptional regulator [Paenibacillus doosanensis]MCS7464323.1 PadR family transcriptional regulator [Paenibacillus doosanensis]
MKIDFNTIYRYYEYNDISYSFIKGEIALKKHFADHARYRMKRGGREEHWPFYGDHHHRRRAFPPDGGREVYYRHGFRGEGRGEGRGGGKRYFGRGDVKFALLELLAAEPMHGYQIMKALEEASGGLYVPSAGSIYPTLQMLEDREWVRSGEQDGKKVYRITDLGQEAVSEWKAKGEREEPRGRGHRQERRAQANPAELMELRESGKDTLKQILLAARGGALQPEQLAALQQLFRQLKTDVDHILTVQQPDQADSVSGSGSSDSDTEQEPRP